MTTNEIFPRIEKKVKEVQELLNFSYDEALIILHHFKWSLEKIETLYLDNPEKYLIESGLKLENFNLMSNKKPAECSICLETNLNNQNLLSPLDCKHTLCSECWKNYINFLVFIVFFYLNFFFSDFRLYYHSFLEMPL